MIVKQDIYKNKSNGGSKNISKSENNTSCNNYHNKVLITEGMIIRTKEKIQSIVNNSNNNGYKRNSIEKKEIVTLTRNCSCNSLKQSLTVPRRFKKVRNITDLK